jgi:hypothetical protein
MRNRHLYYRYGSNMDMLSFPGHDYIWELYNADRVAAHAMLGFLAICTQDNRLFSTTAALLYDMVSGQSADIVWESSTFLEALS